MSDKNVAADTIVLIHGLWMTPLSWDGWAKRYSKLGYRVINRGWPGIDGRSVEDIRRDPKPLEDLSVSRIVHHYENIIRELPHPPIIMGHSFGGLFTQILIDRGLGAAGVAISSAPAKGVLLLPFSTLRVSFPALSNPSNIDKVAPLTPEQFHYAFGNRLSREQSREVYERQAIPGPDHILFQAGFASLDPNSEVTVHFKNEERAPLLFISGDKDHVSPPAVVKMNVALYRQSRAITEYKEFMDRSHYILGEDGWEEVADVAIEWAKYLATTPA